MVFQSQYFSKKLEAQKVIDHIVKWLTDYSENSRTKGFVVGVSGGIDSALTSTLCALTGKPLIVLNLPIYQAPNQVDRAADHINWLESKFDNVKGDLVELTPMFKSFEDNFRSDIQDELTMANVRARLRMTTLYAYAGHHKMLVAGTGNKVEDFGVGFFTKYGDGGVDLSPIADLYKTEVYALAKHLGVIDDIQKAAPTDGLYGDNKTDEMQIGATYPELEWAMEYVKGGQKGELTSRQEEVLKIYNQRHRANKHKMVPIPVCEIPEEYLR